MPVASGARLVHGHGDPGWQDRRAPQPTLPAPDIVQTILDGSAGPHVGVAALSYPLSAAWPDGATARFLARRFCPERTGFLELG